MSEAKFTKGEWWIDEFSSKSEVSVFTNDQRHTPHHNKTFAGRELSDEEMANAYLIAAAPEMYELLSVFSNMVMPTAGELYEQCDKAKALLAKARGEL